MKRKMGWNKKAKNEKKSVKKSVKNTDKIRVFSRISSKVMLIIALAAVLTSSITMLMIMPKSTEQIMGLTKNIMTSMANSYASNIDGSLREKESLTYTEYSYLLKDAKVEGLDSSYAYLVDNKGTMKYHPNQTKVGKPVENVVVKDIVERLEKGQRVDPGFTEYEYKGEMKYASYAVLSDESVLVVTVDRSDASRTSNMLWIRGIVVACLGVVISIIVGFFAIIFIIKPLILLTNVIRETADLDFTDDTEVKNVAKRRDEVGLMGKGVLHMRNNLREMVEKIKNTSKIIFDNVNQVNKVSTQIREQCMNNSATTEELAAGMEESSATTGTITENITEMKNEIADISQLSENGVTLSDEISERANSLREVANEATKRAIEMYDMVKEQVTKSVDAADCVKQINEMTSSIMQISSQTSLLALNASIEAARAGEAGRGFAVVATEISNLASETSNSVTSINKIVNQVNTSVDDMVKSMEDTTRFLDEVVLKDYKQFMAVSDQYNDDADVVKTSMVNVEHAVTELTKEMQMIVEAITGISATIDESALGVTDIAEKTGFVVNETAQNASLVGACMESVEQLEDIAGKFTL